MSLKTDFSARADSQRRADRPAHSWGGSGSADLRRNRARALMSLATGAATAAANRRRPRPPWQRIEDAAAEVVCAALTAHGGDTVAALAAVGIADSPTAIAAAIGGTVAPDLAMVAGADRFLANEHRREVAADDTAADEMTTGIADREDAIGAVADRKRRLQGIDSAAAPLDDDTLAAIDAAYPGDNLRSVRVAIISALAGGVSPDLSGWLGVTEATVRSNVKRGTAALARTMARPGSAADTLTRRKLDAIDAAYSGGRRDPDAPLSRADLVALMDATVPANNAAKSKPGRAPERRRDYAAATRRTRARANTLPPLGRVAAQTASAARYAARLWRRGDYRAILARQPERRLSAPERATDQALADAARIRALYPDGFLSGSPMDRARPAR